MEGAGSTAKVLRVALAFCIFSIFYWGARIKNSNLTLDPRSFHSGKDFLFFVFFSVDWWVFSENFLRIFFISVDPESSSHQNTKYAWSCLSKKEVIVVFECWAVTMTTIAMRTHFCRSVQSFVFCAYKKHSNSLLFKILWRLEEYCLAEKLSFSCLIFRDKVTFRNEMLESVWSKAITITFFTILVQ